jgi:hypothetical protein
MIQKKATQLAAHTTPLLFNVQSLIAISWPRILSNGNVIANLERLTMPLYNDRFCAPCSMDEQKKSLKFEVHRFFCLWTFFKSDRYRRVVATDSFLVFSDHAT